MSIKSKLEEKADEVLDWAARRQFEEDGYNVQWEGDEYRDNWFGIGDKDILTLDRYTSGEPPTGAKGNQSDPNHKYVATKGSDVWKKVREDYSWFKDSVLEFGKGNPRAAKNLGDDVETKIAANLCADKVWGSVANGEDATGWSFTASVPGDELSLENAIDALDPDHWTGQFASKFFTTFGAHGKHWNQVLQGDFFLAANLMAAADAQVATIAAARDDVFRICDAVIDVLKASGGGDSGGSVTPFIYMAGAVVGVALAVGTAGAGAAVVAAAFTITGNLVGMAEAGGKNTAIKKPAGAEKYNISGENVFWTVNSGNNALSRVITVMTEKEGEVATSLWNAYNGVLDNRDDYEIVIKDAESLGLGERDTTSDKSVLIDAATKSFPQAVAPLSAANKALNGLETTSAFAAETYDSTTSIKEPFDAVSDLLQDLTARNAKIVKLAGELIFDFAVDADMVDEDATVELEGNENELKVNDIYDNSNPEGSGRDHEPYEPPPARPPQYR